MPHYVLFYRGRETPPAQHHKVIAAASGVTVLEHDTDRLVLVEATEPVIQELLRSLPGWTAGPETLMRSVG